jgi:superfamily II DNA helicase RecQ
MKIKIFTLQFNSRTESFDDSMVTRFLADKETLSITDYFFTKNDAPYLTLVVRYRPTALPEPAAIQTDGKPKNNKRDESWRELLTEADMPLFKTLRDWRHERAKQDGIPPYVICNNSQLAEVVKTRPGTLTALGALEGFGKKTLEKYGREILSLLSAPIAAQEEPAHA